MFNLVNSNDLNILSSLCSKIIDLNQDDYDLASCCLHFEYIIVMNKGMETYMRQHIASSNGIAAGIEFSQLWTFIWQIHKIVHKADNINRFSHDYITHTILSLKNIWSKTAGFERMQNYVQNDDDSNVKTYELCLKLADTFDQYQMYRQDWLEAWSSFTEEDFSIFNENPQIEGAIKLWLDKNARRKDSIYELLVNNLWQARLWNLIVKAIKNKCYTTGTGNLSDYMTRSEVIKSLCKHHYTQQEIALLPKRVSIIGVSALPSFVYDLFNVLSNHIEIFYMLLNPCQEYWGDLCYRHNELFKDNENNEDNKEYLFKRNPSGKESFIKDKKQNATTSLKSSDFEKVLGDKANFNFEEYERVDGNQLLLSLGREGKENLAVMYDRIENINNTDAFAENDNNTLLNCIKNQLLTLEKIPKRILIKDDDVSIEIHSCHTITREVEVLRNAILTKFKQAQDKGEKLQPRDILVMVPEIENYAPYIEAVFGGIDPKDKNYIPYAISDRASNHESLLADAILRLLACGQTPITASFIVDLLNVKAVAHKFNLDSHDIALITSWCVKASIHRGLDINDLTENESVSKNNFIDLPWTFEHGLERMLDGYALGANTKSGAFVDIEGSDGVVLGKFAEFISRLKNLKDNFPQKLSFFEGSDDENIRPLQRWFYEEILNNFFDVQDPDDERDLSKIKGIISQIRTVTSEFSEKDNKQNTISLLIFRRMIDKALSNQHDSVGYLREKMNFCSLIPMRAVPFKHIFIMGLNDNSFPRHANMPGFNLLSNQSLRRRGDRSQAIDDRYIFLEAILSSQESLYLSYLGQKPVDQKETYPSAVVSELLDYIADNFTTCDDENITDAEYRSQIKKRLIKVEHLNAYDPQNFVKTTCPLSLPSFDESSYIEIKNKELNEPVFLAQGLNFNITLPSTLTVNLDDLIEFFQYPTKFFLRKSLKLSIKSYEQDLPEDDEAYELNKIAYGNLIKNFLNDVTCEDNSLELLDEKIDNACKSGAMPYGVFLNKQRQKLKDTAHYIINTLKDKNITLNSDKKSFELAPFTLKVQDVDYEIYLKGEVPLMNAVINPFKDDSSPKRLIKAFLIGLIQKEIGLQYDYTYVINQQSCDSLPLINDKEQRLQVLKEALSLYIKGLLRPQIGGDACLSPKEEFDINSLNDNQNAASKLLKFETYYDEQRYMFENEDLHLKDDSFIKDDFINFLRFYFLNIKNVLGK